MNMTENDKQSLSMVTCTAPVNIAVIKYWGKRDEDLILPINSSLSITLHQDQLKTTTTIACSRNFQQDRIWLNGKEEDISNPRLQSCLQEIRRFSRKRRNSGDSTSDVSSVSHKVHICSVNNFPTAAGLASSASGYACLVYTLSQLFGVESEQLSAVARQGSGSACRSLYGGFVQWKLGEQLDGKDSLAEQVESESFWPELRILILVVSAEQKSVGSTSGMHTSVETSQLLKVAYTFDAGPNAVIYTLQDHLPEFVQVVRHFFPPEVNGEEFVKGLPVCSADLSEELKRDINMEPTPKGIRYIISTKAGPGPCVVKDPNHHLLGADGLPKKSAISD
ncbi:diphosphomevalonate decarboxylase isoform X4 [Carassius auratus]|uniref:Diphosphomevalonate decarboxylase n=1 Tax=Carassius auratus TaxID=7957 RepID=A0A6P6R9S3_CARAU|nr:diphosphomevalonate decarboxylase isoform X4 [Carassius auratus]XP_052468295.1 diphosphomevalonate decarboxylase isoform X4 [Carassius gibelio]